MIAPRVHLNGTSKASLLEAISAAGAAILKAQEALVETRPNARDYYVINPGALVQAVEEHVARRTKLQTVYNELVLMFEAIDNNQIDFEVEPLS